jgi:hypothetical protein
MIERGRVLATNNAWMIEGRSSNGRTLRNSSQV